MTVPRVVTARPVAVAPLFAAITVGVAFAAGLILTSPTSLSIDQ